MATAIAPRQAPAQPVQVRSTSRRGVIYEVFPDFCPCESFQFGGGRACKHMESAFPGIVARCLICSTERVAVAGDACAGCAHVYGTQALVAVADSTDAEIAETARISQEIRRELAGLPAPDTFLGRLMATPTASERNALALQRHGMSANQGTRLPDRGNDPLAAAF